MGRREASRSGGGNGNGNGNGGAIVLYWVACLAAGGGCATRVVPPAYLRDPVTVYVADYGRHASVVVPTGPRELTEYTYGDWTFFAEGQTSLWNGAAALFWSKQAALGRRTVVDPGDLAQLATRLKARVQSLTVERAKVRDLVAALDARYAAGRGPQIYNAPYELYFVRDAEGYGLFNNSNRMTARWLQRLGCEVHGPALLSKFVVRPWCDE